MSNLVQLEPFINSCTLSLRAKLDQFVQAGTLIDIPRWTQFYAFDVMGEMTVSLGSSSQFRWESSSKQYSS